MRKFNFIATVACTALLVGTWVYSQPDDKEKKPAKKSAAEKWAEMSGPGEEHKGLATLAGDWVQMIRTFQGEKVKETKGKATYRTILGGRFVVEEVKADVGGFKWEWMGIYGYDKHKKVFTATWFDDMDTTTESAEGTFDDATKTLTFVGQHDNPGTGKMEKFKWTIRWEDQNRQVTVTMLGIDENGKDQKKLEIVQTRPK